MIKRDILFEIGTEEIPARFVTWVIGELENVARAGLAELRLKCGNLKVTGTPRRIVLYVSDLADRQEDFEETIKGPPKNQSVDENGQYTAAALGFAKSRGVSVSDLRFFEVKGTEYLHAVVHEDGKDALELLPGFLSGLLKKIVFPKNMYWEEQGVRFARPVRWIVALADSAIVPVRFGGVASGAESRGHRFMGAKSVQIESAHKYEETMEREFVIVDHERRKKMIMDGISKIEKEIGCVADRDSKLLEENAHLVEYPVPFLGSFESEFLDIPEEVLIATMKKNQRYFPVRNKDGRISAYFIGVSNNKARDMSVVRDGNERVLRARLHDAAFFWEEDLSSTLESRLPRLEKLLYQERLGSIRDKTERVRSACAWLLKEMKETKIAPAVDRAALLSKADLVTGMVFEFPEVQGVMGREYALREGEPAEVAEALFEQYLPRFAGDGIPNGKVGAILGICDRADTIIAIHKAGLPPTGSQDPYGLRRAARGINEVIWGLSLDVDIDALFAHAAKSLGADKKALEKSVDFYRQRLHNQLRERGYTHRTTSLAAASMGSRPLQALRMLEAFENVNGEPWFESLVLSAVRVVNILNKMPDKDKESLASKKNETGFSTDAERALDSALDKQGETVKRALEAKDWASVCKALSELSGVITGFFDGVMVMDPDPRIRAARVVLLMRCKELFDSIGDFSLLK
ncbi:MAG: glycine--tRNA ligase subunit beta [Synergistaceae bacterium]|jgi:glycyl-tRNA synthetase beta chain|nr:glycine--tRNA ligase subunit beta [Synergistaceae bacterium]